MVGVLMVALGILVGASAWDAPGGAGGVSTPPDERSVSLRLDQEAEADGLRLSWTSVADSRCPKGVACVWAGEVTVKIRVRDGGEESEIALTQGARPDGDVARTARHEIRLRDVSPYPHHGATVRREDYRATVAIRRP
jgi:hypothetical protein